MVLTILIVLAVVVVGICAYAASRPDAFRIERSTSIGAPAARVFANLNDFHVWSTWSPWEKLDPALQRSFSGPTSGKGAAYEWEGNSKVGKGRMEIMDAAPPDRLVIKLDFLRPFEAHNKAEFTLKGNGNATQVNWAMYGPSPFMSKVMGIFMNMDQLIGKDFEKGLANLKSVSEA